MKECEKVLTTENRLAPILIIVFAVSYTIIALLNLFDIVSSKVILLCSIVSLSVSIAQIIDSVICALETLKKKILLSLLHIFIQWGKECDKENISNKQEKVKLFYDKKENLQKNYNKKIKLLNFISNSLLIISIGSFVVGLSIDISFENTKIADTITLFSFALIFASIALKDYLSKYVQRFSKEIDSLIELVGVLEHE